MTAGSVTFSFGGAARTVTGREGRSRQKRNLSLGSCRPGRGPWTHPSSDRKLESVFFLYLFFQQGSDLVRAVFPKRYCREKHNPTFISEAPSGCWVAGEQEKGPGSQQTAPREGRGRVPQTAPLRRNSCPRRGNRGITQLKRGQRVRIDVSPTKVHK